MAKGQKRSNREFRKPKQDNPKAASVTDIATPLLSKGTLSPTSSFKRKR